MSKLLFSYILLKRVLKTEILTYCTFLKISHFDLDSVHLGDFSSFSFIFIFFLYISMTLDTFTQHWGCRLINCLSHVWNRKYANRTSRDFPLPTLVSSPLQWWNSTQRSQYCFFYKKKKKRKKEGKKIIFIIIIIIIIVFCFFVLFLKDLFWTQ